eukprot:10435948-Ditylum_brightwellii.AAC.1
MTSDHMMSKGPHVERIQELCYPLLWRALGICYPRMICALSLPQFLGCLVKNTTEVPVIHYEQAHCHTLLCSNCSFEIA